MLALLGTGGCAVVSPLIDRDMSKAPNSACADLAVPAPAGERPCFVLVEEDAAGARSEWRGGRLTPERTLVAVYRPGEGCDGRFSHLTVTGTATESGRAALSVWDTLGRVGHMRAVRWRTPFPLRTLVLAGIDSATLNPAGARVRVTEGSFDPATLCFRSY